MDGVYALPAFTANTALLTITPGMDTALVLRTAAADGPRQAFQPGRAIVVGCFAWGLLTAIDLGTPVAVPELGYATLKIVGAAYLGRLGARLLLVCRKPLPPADRLATQRGHFRLASDRAP